MGILYDWLNDIKRSKWTMTPLQEVVTKLGICSHCHTKTLEELVNGNGYRWQQCSKCGTCWVDDERLT